MRKKTAQEEGYDFEGRFGAVLGVKPTRGSGNQWTAKMDLGDASVLVSCKHTQAQSFRVEKGHLREIQSHCVGEQEPVMAIDVDGEIFIVQRAGDWIAGRTEEGGRFIEPSRSEIKRRTARIPALLRETSE